MFHVLKSVMRLKFLVLFSLIALCVSCRKQGGGVLSPEIDPSTPFSAPSAPSGSEPGSTQGEGTGSGGGSFGDTYAKETLSIAKGALARMIRAASPELFAKLPVDRRQEWLADLISRVELRKEISPSRYGNPLKFDYDLKTQTIFATNFFVSTFPYGRFWTRPLIEQHRILLEVMTDILHEASHFYGIGVTEESDPNAEAWAMLVMDYLSQDNLACKSEPLGAAGFSIIYVHRPSGIFVARGLDRVAQDSKQYEDWRTKLEVNPFRYLTSPELFLNQGVELAKWEKEARDGWLENPAQPIHVLAALAQVKIETVFDKPQDEFRMAMSANSRDSIAYVAGDKGARPRWGVDAFGIPIVSESKISYDREQMYCNQVLSTMNSALIEDIPAQNFDQFVLDRKMLTATYTYGIKANGSKLTEEEKKASGSPLFSDSYKYQCERISRKQITVKEFLGEKAIPPSAIVPAEIERNDEDTRFVPLESKKNDYTEFADAANSVMKNNLKKEIGGQEEVEVWGKSDAGFDCTIMFYMSDEASQEKTLVFTISEMPKFSGSDKTYGRRSFLQTNFVVSDSHVYSVDSGVFYTLQFAKSSPVQISLRQSQSGRDNVEFESGTESFFDFDSEMVLKTDPESGQILSATAIDYKNGIKPLTCTAK